ncbi:MAG TPA: hypothetical protein VK966_04985, partial [Longimicrobiales bacterium]|nr:hypothetical protein [Longimicrobiales bacterium]
FTLIVVLAGCGGGATAGGSEAPGPPPPAVDLTGTVVMLLPSQTRTPGLDAELGFWLGEAGARTEWVGPAELQAIVDRSPGWRVQLDALPSGIAEVNGSRRVQEPLFSHLRRLGAMVDTRLALIPLAREVSDSAGAAVEVTAFLVDVVGGRVAWTGTVRGNAAPPGDPPSVASAAEALARALVAL